MVVISVSSPGPKGPGNPLNPGRAWDRELQLSLLNEEFPVSASHQLALITSLPFVHTARRYYRLNAPARPSDWRRLDRFRPKRIAEKSFQFEYLEEVKVVTRFP